MFFKKHNINIKFFNIHTHLTEEEKIKLYDLSLSLNKGSSIVEIGSYLGASSLFLASAAKTKKHTIYCIDTWQNQSMTEGIRDTYREFCNNIKPMKKYINIIRGYSSDIAQDFNETIDCIFFDADHSYESIKQDWESWKPKLAPEALLIFHDWGWAEGVKKVIREDVIPVTKEIGNLPNMWWGKYIG